MDVAVCQDDQLDAFRLDVLHGLSRAQKTLPSRWLYDPRGCELFEQITTVPEYYPTRTETAILKDHAAEISEFCGAQATCSNMGAGPASRPRSWWASLDRPRSYIPIDIAAGFLDLTAARFRQHFSNLAVNPVVADFTSEFSVPDRVLGEGRRVAFFPARPLEI
ncbi:MAG: L-histidine N(alpha)-methyltransferase [Steroidobacteraceae bacterium]